MKQFLVFIAILLHCNLYAQNFNIDEYFQKGLDAFENSKNEEAIFYLTPCENYYSQIMRCHSFVISGYRILLTRKLQESD